MYCACVHLPGFESLVTTTIIGTETQVKRIPETHVQFWRNIACQIEKHARGL